MLLGFATPSRALSVCHFGEAGWRRILLALSTAPHIPSRVDGLGMDFVKSTTFDPVVVLQSLRWPAELLEQPDPDKAILEFCRALSKGAFEGDPVASVVVLGPGAAGKSTLLWRLNNRRFNSHLKSTNGLHIGA